MPNWNDIFVPQTEPYNIEALQEYTLRDLSNYAYYRNCVPAVKMVRNRPTYIKTMNEQKEKFTMTNTTSNETRKPLVLQRQTLPKDFEPTKTTFTFDFHICSRYRYAHENWSAVVEHLIQRSVDVEKPEQLFFALRPYGFSKERCEVLTKELQRYYYGYRNDAYIFKVVIYKEDKDNVGIYSRGDYRRFNNTSISWDRTLFYNTGITEAQNVGRESSQTPCTVLESLKDKDTLKEYIENDTKYSSSILEVSKEDLESSGVFKPEKHSGILLGYDYGEEIRDVAIANKKDTGLFEALSFTKEDEYSRYFVVKENDGSFTYKLVSSIGSSIRYEKFRWREACGWYNATHETPVLLAGVNYINNTCNLLVGPNSFDKSPLDKRNWRVIKGMKLTKAIAMLWRGVKGDEHFYITESSKKAILAHMEVKSLEHLLMRVGETKQRTSVYKFSANPEHMAECSDNTTGWSSCFRKGGEYAFGAIGFAMSPETFMITRLNNNGRKAGRAWGYYSKFSNGSPMIGREYTRKYGEMNEVQIDQILKHISGLDCSFKTTGAYVSSERNENYIDGNSVFWTDDAEKKDRRFVVRISNPKCVHCGTTLKDYVDDDYWSKRSCGCTWDDCHDNDDYYDDDE